MYILQRVRVSIWKLEGVIRQCDHLNICIFGSWNLEVCPLNMWGFGSRNHPNSDFQLPNIHMLNGDTKYLTNE